LLDLLYSSTPEMANAINTATITPITVGDQNPPDEVVVGGKVTNPFPEPEPPEPPDDEPPEEEPPEDEEPEFGVGEADDVLPPITVNDAPAWLPRPSVAVTVESPPLQSPTVIDSVKSPFVSVALTYPNN
jgi:hypothetical protein